MQVRQPVYQRSVARWKNYEPALADCSPACRGMRPCYSSMNWPKASAIALGERVALVLACPRSRRLGRLGAKRLAFESADLM